MSNSSLATYTLISPNRTSPRKHKIDTITIHCFVGQVTAKRGAEVFQPVSKEASCNYVVGYDGQISLVCPEADRSWCSSNGENDHRAVTIEVASDNTEPYAITDKAYKSLIELCADICERNGIKELKWQGNKDLIGQVDKQNMTVHRWFIATSCPGDYLYKLHGQIAKEVNAKLRVESEGKEVTFEEIVEAMKKIGYTNCTKAENTITFSKAQNIKKGDKVKVLNKVTYSGQKFTTYYSTYDVIEVVGERAVIGIGKTVTCAINVKDIEKV